MDCSVCDVIWCGVVWCGACDVWSRLGVEVKSVGCETMKVMKAGKA